MKLRLFPLGIRSLAAIAVMLLLSLSAYSAFASATGDAYAKFNQTRSSGAGDDAIYNALHECYKAAMGQLDSSEPGSEAFNEARMVLAEIHPFLRSGAFYSSSKNNQNNALVFACAYMDVPLHKAFQGVHFDRDEQFANLAYFAASGVYNRGDKKKAIPYFQAYLETGDQKHRKDVFAFMSKACIENGQRALATQVLRQGIAAYPNDFNMLSVAINNAIEDGDNESLQEFVTKAVALRPNEETLLNIQGKMYEDTQQFQNALNVYTGLRRSKPNSLQIAKHVALNYYNLGVLNYNKAQMEGNTGAAKKLDRQAKEFFSAAATTLEDIVKTDPSASMYMQALATAYSCMGEAGKLKDTNSRLANMGIGGVAENIIPQIMNFDNKPSASSVGGGTMLASSSTTPAAGGFTAPTADPVTGEMPKYSEFAKKYVEKNIESWQAKDPYETVSEYQARVTEATRDAKVKDLLKEAEKQYIATYTKGLKLNNMQLKPYDAENGVFLVESNFGELVVPVPRTNEEARVFESGWNGMQFKNPEFYINDDRLLLSSLTFVTPTGKSYKFDADKNLGYTETVVDISFGKIEDSLFAQNNSKQGAQSVKKENKVTMGRTLSDVDKDLPQAKTTNDKTFAVIIANENYGMVAPVPMALNDGEVFSQYCTTTLGLPENNVRLYKDASFGTMLRAIRDIKDIADAFAGDIQVIFYYAGHGIPNEATKDAFLLPIDADGMTTDGCYSLNRLYSELNDLKAQSTVVFLDACFSGAKRDGEMLASARGVALRPKKEEPKGNMVIFSAASDEETAFPYTEKGHGLFTYFLLKKLKESKGNVQLGELADYLKTNVKQQSVVVNRKSQTPTVSAASNLAGTWEKMKLGR